MKFLVTINNTRHLVIEKDTLLEAELYMENLTVEPFTVEFYNHEKHFRYIHER